MITFDTNSVSQYVFYSKTQDLIEKHKLFSSDTETYEFETKERSLDDFISLFNNWASSKYTLHFSKNESNNLQLVYANESVVVLQYIHLHTGMFVTQVHASDLDLARSVQKDVKQLLESKLTKTLTKTPTNFPAAVWSMTESGASFVIKYFNFLEEKDLSCNYSNKIFNGIKSLPDKIINRNGNIVIWTGEPGTGKSTAIKFLLGECYKQNIMPEIIFDVEKLFASPSYMKDLLLSTQTLSAINREVVDLSSTEQKTTKMAKRLIILEDSADFFSMNCRNNPGFSRLLNVTDGLLSDGDFKLLLTANESVETFDPAIVRPGRCIQQLSFDKLKDEDLDKWSEFNNVPADSIIEDEYTLADLYAIKNDPEYKPAVKAARVGF